MSCCLVTSWIASQSKLRVCASQQVCQPSQNYTGPRLCSESSLSPGNNNNGPDGITAPNKTVKTKSDAGGRSETQPSGPSLRPTPLSLHEDTGNKFWGPMGIQKSVFALDRSRRQDSFRTPAGVPQLQKEQLKLPSSPKISTFLLQKTLCDVINSTLGAFIWVFCASRIIGTHRESGIQLFGGSQEAFSPRGFLFWYIQYGGDGSALVFVFN